MRILRNSILAAALALAPVASAQTESCVESYGTPLPTNIIVGAIALGDRVLWNNIWGMRGRASDDFRQCIFEGGGESGWTWTKGETDPACYAPQGQSCAVPDCMYQFSFASLEYGVSPWGLDTGATDMPLHTGSLESLVVTHDVTYEVTDDLPGQRGGVLFPGHPPDIYPRHALVYDLFLTTRRPGPGVNVSPWLTDEVIIMMNFNAEYPDTEACDISAGPPVEANAVFDGFHTYDYHSFSDLNAIGQNYHQFRRVGGDAPGAAVPAQIDLAPFLRYLKQRHDQPDLWLGRVVLGQQLYDHTHGSITFHSAPDYAITQPACSQKCQRKLAREGTRFARARIRELARCERLITRDKLVGSQDCATRGDVSTRVAKAAARLEARIGKACHDESATPSGCEPGWGRFCPDHGGDCSRAIDTSDDLAACLECTHQAATTRANGVTYDAMIRPAADPAVVSCQEAIGKQAERLQAGAAKTLQRCEDRRLRGLHADTCPDPGLPPGSEGRKAADRIDKAEARAAAAICKACGGSDGTCDGAGDLDPQAEIGFQPACEDLTVPGGAGCTGPVDSMQDLVDCLLCVTRYEALCMDRVRVPAGNAYPAECTP